MRQLIKKPQLLPPSQTPRLGFPLVTTERCGVQSRCGRLKVVTFPRRPTTKALPIHFLGHFCGTVYRSGTPQHAQTAEFSAYGINGQHS